MKWISAAYRAARNGVLAVVLFACVSFPAVNAEAHGVTLDIHHPLAVDSAFHNRFLLDWVHRVEKESGGRLHFHLHPGSSATTARGDLYEQMIAGEADVVWTSVVPTGDRFSGLAAFVLPFIVHHAQGASRALWEYVRANDIAERDFGEVHMIAVHVGDGSQLHWRTSVNGSIADFTQRRVAVTEPNDAVLLKAMGLTPVEVQPLQLASALGNGSVDATLLPWERLGALGIGHLTPTHIEFGPMHAGLRSSIFVLAMSRSSYQSLSDDLKAVIDANSGIETSAWLGRVMDEAADEARKVAAGHGDALRKFSQEDLDRWRKAGRVVTDVQIKSLERQDRRASALLDSARQYLQKFDLAP